MKDTEVEITYPLLNPDPVRTLLEERGTFSYEQRQIDTYYTPAHRDFLKEQPISDWLRVRETNNGTIISFKHWHNQSNEQAVSCDEFETGVENADTMHKILQKLNFRKLVVVDKTRRAYLYKDVEIAFDSVVGLGDFIELEAKGQFDSIDKATELLYSLLREIGAEIGKQDYKGYPHLLLEKEGIW